MARYRIIDTATWPRRDHFTFYRQFANPSFNLCVPIAAQRLYECAKDRRVSFFQLALYALLRAANGVPQLRQRVRNDEVIEYAKEIDAKVYVDEEQKSKGDCLDYCIRHILMSGRKYDGYMIVDADCRLDADFMKNMNDALESGAQVITARKLVGKSSAHFFSNSQTGG